MNSRRQIYVKPVSVTNPLPSQMSNKIDFLQAYSKL
jgi:hypothetical protein